MSRGEKRIWATAAAISLGISLLLYHGLFPHFSSTMVGFGNGDPNQAAWFLANTAHAIATLTNPFVSHLINVPDGANMMANTSTIAVGALFAPITLGFGPVVALNVVFIVGIAATTWSFAFVARRMGLSLPAALLVGILIGFAPIRMIHGQGQPFLIFAVGTPWLMYAVWRLIEGRATSRRIIVECAFWVTWSALVSLERLFIIALPIAVYATIRLWQRRNHESFPEQLRRTGLTVGLSSLVLAWPLYEFTFGEQSLHGPPHDWLMGYSSHVRDFFAAGPWMLLEDIGPSDHPTGFLAGSFIDASYIGIPILIAFIWGAWRLRKNCAALCLTAASLVSLVMACGPHVAWTETGWRIPGPYKLLQHVPGFSSAHPLNFQIVSAIGIAFVIGLALDDYWKSPHARRSLVVVASLVLVLSIAPDHAFSTTHVGEKTWLTSDEGRRVIPPGTVVLTYPYPQNIINSPMLDQAIAGMRYRLVGGQVTVPDPEGNGQSVQPLYPKGLFNLFARSYLGTDLLTLYNVPVGPLPPKGPETRAMLREFVHKNNVDVIVMEFSGVDPVAVVQRLNDAFGTGHVRHESNVIWWNVRKFS